MSQMVDQTQEFSLCKKSQIFTLIELLVVIAIIAILAGPFASGVAKSEGERTTDFLCEQFEEYRQHLQRVQ